MTTLKNIADQAKKDGFLVSYSAGKWVKDEFKYEFVPLGSSRPAEWMEDRENLEIRNPDCYGDILIMSSKEGGDHVAIWKDWSDNDAMQLRAAAYAEDQNRICSSNQGGDSIRQNRGYYD